MAGKQGKRSNHRTPDQPSVRDLLFSMEPEIQLLEGVVALLRILAEADDSIEPVAIAAVADCCGEAVSEVSTSWRAALAALNERQPAAS
jgi:hypothetical protein